MDIVTIDKFPGIRFIVNQDECAEDPVVESGANVSMFAYRGGYESTISTPSHYLHTVFLEFLHRFNNDDGMALGALQRFTKVFLGNSDSVEIALYQYRGYSQGDWLDILAISEGEGDPVRWCDSWASWARGDVYTVRAEHSSPCSLGHIHWGSADDDIMELGGIYADTPEDAARYFATDYL